MTDVVLGAVKVLSIFSGAKCTNMPNINTTYGIILSEKTQKDTHPHKSRQTTEITFEKSIAVTHWKNIDRRKSNYNSLPLSVTSVCESSKYVCGYVWVFIREYVQQRVCLPEFVCLVLVTVQCD